MHYIDTIIAVLVAFAMVLSVTIAAGTASGLIKLFTIVCVLVGTGLIVSKLLDYREE